MSIKILATIGPASLNKDTIEELSSNGVNLFRINLSHTKLDDVANIIDDTTYTFSDSYANGQIAVCAYISDSLIVNPIYRMSMVSGDFECSGDIQFNE